MSEYMLLLYAEPTDDPAEQERRDSEMPVWMELYANLREQGVLVSTGRLHPVDVATTIRQRGSEPEIVDGPFAVTKEVLAGYYVLECADLDDALRHAKRIPLIRYGSVEVRPVMADPMAAEDARG
jgi:hypothetical protein